MQELKYKQFSAGRKVDIEKMASVLKWMSMWKAWYV